MGQNFILGIWRLTFSGPSFRSPKGTCWRGMTRFELFLIQIRCTRNMHCVYFPLAKIWAILGVPSSPSYVQGKNWKIGQIWRPVAPKLYIVQKMTNLRNSLQALVEWGDSHFIPKPSRPHVKSAPWQLGSKINWPPRQLDPTQLVPKSTMPQMNRIIRWLCRILRTKCEELVLITTLLYRQKSVV